MKATKWMIDGKVNLTEAAEKANWHLATTIQNLTASGVAPRDAEAFANFIFNEYVTANRGVTDHDSEDCVTDAQYDRLTV